MNISIAYAIFFLRWWPCISSSSFFIQDFIDKKALMRLFWNCKQLIRKTGKNSNPHFLWQCVSCRLIHKHFIPHQHLLFFYLCIVGKSNISDVGLSSVRKKLITLLEAWDRSTTEPWLMITISSRKLVVIRNVRYPQQFSL